MIKSIHVLGLALVLALGTSTHTQAERSEDATTAAAKRGPLDEGDRERWKHHPDWAKAWSFNRKLYRATKPRTIAYGSTARPSMLIGEIDPPFVTPERDQVEVMPFQMYANRGWTINQPVEHKWIRSLPDEVRVRYAPSKSLFQTNPIPAEQRRRAIRQNLYLTAVEMGIPARKAHGLIVRAVARSLNALETERTHRNYAKLLKLDPDAFQAMRTSAAVRWRETEADMLERGQSETMFELGRRLNTRARGESRERMYPELLIGGRYVVSMTNTLVVRETYWMANWAIKRSLKDLDENRHWPRSAAELAEWLVPYDGQILSRIVNGVHQKYPASGFVYKAETQTLWGISSSGEPVHEAKLTTDAHGTHFIYTDSEGRPSYLDVWRATRQLAPWIDIETGEPERHAWQWVGERLAALGEPMRLRGAQETWSVSLESDGTATAEIAGASQTALWRIHGPDLEITLESGQTGRWTWRTEAKRNGIRIHGKSMAPWHYAERFETTPNREADQVARSAAAEPSTTAKAEPVDEVTASTQAAIEQLRQKVRAALRGEHEGGN